MKKTTAIDFISNAKIPVPIAISHLDMSVDYETESSTTKTFEEQLSVQLAGETHIFISEITESWDFVDEGNGASHMLSGVHNYTLSSPTLNESRDVAASSLFTFNKIDELTKGNYGRKLSHDSEVASFHYMLKSENNDTPELDKIFEMALAAKVCALNSPDYKSSWNGTDTWADSGAWDNDSAVNHLCQQSPNFSHGMVIDVPLTNRTYEIFREHIAANNPDIDMRVLDGYQSATMRLNQNHELEEARDLVDKLTSVMRSCDRVTQIQMLQFIEKSALQVATHFIRSSHDRIYNPSNSRQDAELGL